ncbi:MAG: homoserine kinase [Pseudomonadota bacterium]
MAVYTEVTDAALTAYLEDYELGAVTSFKGIAGGVENTNYALQTQRGQYILTLYEKRVSEVDLPFFIGLMDHLSSAGFPCPKPVRNRAGEALSTLAGRPAAMVSFLEGLDVKHPDAALCEEAGKAMAKLHAAANGFDICRTNALAPHGWPQLVSASRAGADGVESGLEDLITKELEHLAKDWPTDIPAGVIHADMFPDNVFFLDGRLSGVIDFYFACNDFLAYDIAVALNAWCFDSDFQFDPKKSAAFLMGYQQHRRLTETERDALPTLCRGAALRFLLTRLYDWLNVPPGALVVPHDPKAFSARLRHFQTVMHARDLELA